MVWELTPALVFTVLVIATALRTKPRWFRTGGLPSVGDAPPSATPVAWPRLDDNGLGTYSLDLPRESGDRDAAAGSRRLAPDRKARARL